MAGVKISDLPAAPSSLTTDLIPAVQNGVTYKETLAQLITLFSSQLTGTFLPLVGGTMTGPLILNADATLPLQAVTYEQLQTVAAGFTVILACQAATTGNLNATPAGAGIGATLTNAGANAAFAVDGYSASLNDRILVKNQTLSQHNGVYTVTTVGNGATPWVLTRATDYDTAAQIKPGTLVAINNGTQNATTSWLETATVTVVDTDPVLFSQFTFSPSTFLLKANNLSDLVSVATALVNLGLGVPTGTGNVVLQTSPTLITPNIGAATAVSLAFNPTTGGIIGTTAADNAGAGKVGEYMSSLVVVGSAVGLSNGASKSITSISLTPGDWDVWGEVSATGAGSTQIIRFQAGISTANNTLPTFPSDSGSYILAVAGTTTTSIGIVWTPGGTSVPAVSLSPCRLNINAPTTVYLVVNANFSVSTCSAYGKICARRVR